MTAKVADDTRDMVPQLAVLRHARRKEEKGKVWLAWPGGSGQEGVADRKLHGVLGKALSVQGEQRIQFRLGTSQLRKSAQFPQRGLAERRHG